MAQHTPLTAKALSKAYFLYLGWAAVIVSLGIFGCTLFSSEKLTPAGAGLWVLISLMLYGSACALAVLLTQFIRIFCPHCGKHIEAMSDWCCAYCDEKNTSAFNMVVQRCSRCKREPKALTCPHCSKLSFLDADNETQHPATIVLQKEETEPIPNARGQQRQEHLIQKEQLEHEIEIAALSRRLTALKSSPEFKEELSAKELVGKAYSDFEASVLGVKMLEREKRLENQRTLQNDPDLLEMREIALDAFVEQQGMTPTRLPSKEKGTAERSL